MRNSLYSPASAVLILVLTFLNRVSCAQWTPVFHKNVMEDTLYNLRKDGSFTPSYHITFPEYSFYDNLHALRGGFPCKTLTARNDMANSAPEPLPGEIAVWYRRFDAPFPVRNDTSVFLARVYTDNIRSYTIYFYDAGNRSWHRKEVRLNFEGLQIPLNDVISGWPAAPTDQSLPARQPDGKSSLLCITVTPADTLRKWEFVLGDLVIGDQYIRNFQVQHPFFSSYTVKPVTPVKDRRLWSDYLPEVPDEMNEYLISSRISMQATTSVNSDSLDRALLRRVLFGCLDNYPFYKERKLDRDTIRNELSRIFGKFGRSGYCTLVDTLSQFIALRFTDLHFYIERPKGSKCEVPDYTRVKGPIYLEDIRDTFRIAADFDTTNPKLHLNEEVVAIDNIPVRNVYDSLSKAWYRTSSLNAFQKHIVVSGLLDRNRGDSCKLRVYDPLTGRTDETVVKYDRKYRIPDNFRPIHCEFRKYPDSICYFKINAWEESVYLQFVNHWKEIENSRALIFDLRGNGGGELMTAMQLFSVFINRPTVYLNFLAANGNSQMVKVNPDPWYHYRTTRRIVILSDQTTACTSETFIQAMRQTGHTQLIAFGNTAGSLAGKYDITLPSGVIVHTNSIQRKICYGNTNISLETIGITPDLILGVDKVEDLRPYQDKLCKEAIKILSADKRD